MEAGKSNQGHPWLYKEFKANLGFTKPNLKKTHMSLGITIMLCLFSIIIVLSSLLGIMTSLPDRYGFHFIEWTLDKNQKVVGYSHIICIIIVPVSVSS